MCEEGKNKMNIIKIMLKIGVENLLMSCLRVFVIRFIVVVRFFLFILFEILEC